MKLKILILLLLITPLSAFGLDANIDQSNYNWYEGLSITGHTEITNGIKILVEIKCNQIIDSQLITITNNEFWYGTSIRGYYWENNQCGNYTALVTYGNQTITIPFSVEQVPITITEAPVIIPPVIIQPTPEYNPPQIDLPPVITILGDNPQYMTAGNNYIEFGATAIDVIDGDISNQTAIDTSELNTLIPASYAVHYAIMDSVGNINSANRTVIVQSFTIPEVVDPISHILNLIDTMAITDSFTNNSTALPIPQITTEIPTWIKGVFGYWAEGKLSDTELKDAIKFLINQGIIVLD